MKLLLPILFISALSYSQETSVTILNEYNHGTSSVLGDYSYKIKLVLTGSDSKDVALNLHVSDYGIQNTSLKVVFHGEKIYLLEKLIDKHNEWNKLAQEKQTDINKEMYSVAGSNDIIASGYSYYEYTKDSYRDIKCGASSGIFSAYGSYLASGNGSLYLKYSCDGISVSVSLDYTEEIKKFYSSGKFQEALNEISNTKETWDEFEPIKD